MTSVIDDEYTQYINSALVILDESKIKDFNPRAWWLEPTQRRTYPNLSKMALDFLSVPAMSAEVERLFSSCKITITNRRNRIGIDAVEAIECLKSWLRKNNISFVDSELDYLVDELGNKLEKGKGKGKGTDNSGGSDAINAVV